MLIVHILNSLCIGGIEKAVTEIQATKKVKMNDLIRCKIYLTI